MIVVDASAFLSVVLGEPAGDAVLRALLDQGVEEQPRERRSGSRAERLVETLVAPEFLALEVTNSILQMRHRARRLGMSVDPASVVGVGTDRLANAVRAHFEELGVTLESFSSRVDFERTCQIAELCGLSAYDAVYVAFAEHRGARLLTLDKAMSAAATSIGITTLPAMPHASRDPNSDAN